jgi:Na+/H+ antiporter NhaD/arsenite permease-like protein
VALSVIIFSVVSFNFLFPCNSFIPLDRRTTAVVGALACYLLGSFVFPSRSIDMLHAIDFDVLVLLASIMVVNHIVVHLRETKKLIYSFQCLLRRDGVRGFWVLSFIAFIVSPFLTNDGVCLLLVEPVLNTFEPVSDAEMSDMFTQEKSTVPTESKIDNAETAEEMQQYEMQDPEAGHDHEKQRCLKNSDSRAAATSKGQKSDALPPLTREDAFYFLLALACATNIGSALTYTGNPQNMIVASDAIDVLPPYRFTMYMLLPALVTWFMTIKVIEICWHRNQTARREQQEALRHLQTSLTQPENILHNRCVSPESSSHRASSHSILTSNSSTSSGRERKRKRRTATILSTATEEGGPQSPPNGTVGHSPRRKSSSRRRSHESEHSAAPRFNLSSQEGMTSPLALDPCHCLGEPNSQRRNTTLSLLSPSGRESKASDGAAMLSPRRRRARQHEQEQMLQRVVRVVASPFPYLVILLLFAMIVMIFVDIMPISSLICVAAIVMVLAVVFGNHCCRNGVVWESVHDSQSKSLAPKTSQSVRYVPAAEHEKDDEQLSILVDRHEDSKDHLGPMTREDKLDSLNEFFEELFNSIDYSLLFIFLGTFIVVENMAETGIPRRIWRSMVGNVPFASITSIANISVFILLASQLLGNVAVVQLAKPNVGDLPANEKRMAWAIISFVSTVGGNLTITGSAANIIVAEKANRLDPTIQMNFFRHFKICFAVTLLSCVVGASMLYAIISLDNYLMA